MNILETHEVTFTLKDEEQLVRPIPSYARYRGRKDVNVVVYRVTVDLITGHIVGEGSVVLRNGSTSGYGHRAQLTQDDLDRFAQLAVEHVGSRS